MKEYRERKKGRRDGGRKGEKEGEGKEGKEKDKIGKRKGWNGCMVN
jgi:hypothetical protein